MASPIAVFRWLVLAPAALAFLPGCARFERTLECRRFASTVNAMLDQIEARQKLGPESAQTYQEIAQYYEELDEALEQLSFKEEELNRAVSDYRTFSRSTAAATRQAATALGQEPPARKGGNAGQLAALVQQQKGLNRSIEHACRGS